MKTILDRPMSRAALLAVCIEAGLLGLLAWAMAQAQQHVEPPPTPVMLSFPVLPAPPHKEVPKPPRPLPHPPQPQVHKPQVQPRIPTPPPLPLPVPVASTPAVPTPPKVTAPPTQPSKPKLPVTPPAPPQPDPHLLATFNDQVLGAVQSAVQYPLAARMAHMHGRTQIGFNYLDGAVSNVSVLKSSGYHALDDAAIQAVMTAHYPPPPGALRGHSLPFALWVVHRLQSED